MGRKIMPEIATLILPVGLILVLTVTAAWGLGKLPQPLQLRGDVMFTSLGKVMRASSVHEEVLALRREAVIDAEATFRIDMFPEFDAGRLTPGGTAALELYVPDGKVLDVAAVGIYWEAYAQHVATAYGVRYHISRQNSYSATMIVWW